MFVCSMMSLICLAITLFIFCYFKSLQCSRISIHKNLAVAFLIRFVFQLVFIEPYFSQRPKSYRDIDWLCKTLTTLNLFSMMASIFWMFVEGLFLHNRIAVSVFDTEAPFLLFYFIGWGLPSVFTVTWALVRELAYTNEVEVDLKRYINDEECWGGDFEGRASTWILVAPAMLVLVVNLIFLVNIIRILVTKLRANNARESEAAQWRKAIKATAILLPLLGITNLLFFYNPKDKGPMEKAYLFINALLQNSQGIFVAVLYCFLNAEVRQCIRRRYERIMLRRSTGGAIANMRSRGSRTSTMFLSQSDVALAITFRNKFMSRKSRNGGECDKTPPDPVPPSPPTSNGLGRDDVITPTRPNTYMLDIDADVENNDYYSPIADERL
ncbi:PREDICTED: corticotropin-releasing factor receptor 2-like [Priapulus caudatus]|uniref:Corticotropin-releasing factor receptor 2-like n=1 Tax=Priapulus caudatus TaxID=37621 RepID=A0ABM1DNF9_PRICU|nr:PREDICTED: corticotropin-releasing factor receptor 2-like [Priapulus caudatus]